MRSNHVLGDRFVPNAAGCGEFRLPCSGAGVLLAASRTVRWLVVAGLLSALVACQKSEVDGDAGIAKEGRSQNAAESVAESAAGGDVITSDNDSRDYAYFKLPNRLGVLLISDAEAEKSAVSLNVSAGSKDDPAEREGLAHFLEHMLFLGTEKYPVAGEYQAFIAANGGQHNAYTSFTSTNYFFDINSARLEPALDRFSQFFIAPLFTAKYVDREKHAVESEYRAKLKSEARRGLEAFRATLNPAHPFSHFSVGNLETLADREGSSVRQELLAFYQQHYSANRMSLVVLGNRPIAELKAMVEQRFAAVADRNSTNSELTMPLFGDGALPGELRVTPEQNLRSLSLAFPVADPQPHWQAQPLHLIGDVLGHEGEGSLLQYLKARGWAEGLSAGAALEYRSGATFNISIALTEGGYAQRDEVIAAVFQAVNRLRQDGISQQRFDEQRRISELRFRFSERSENVEYVMGLAARMAYYPPAMIVKGPHYFGRYEASLYDDYLAQLSPDRVLVTVTGPGLDTPQRSPLYQTPYAFSPVPAGRVKSWSAAGVNPAITMPAANPFIPEDTQRHRSEAVTSRPEQIPGGHKSLAVWWGDDARFPAPKASTRLLLESALANDTAEHAVLLDLFAAMVSDSLNAKLYPATLAGFKVAIQPSRRGLQVGVDGFSDKQLQLWRLLADQIEHAEFSGQRFTDVKQQLVRGWQNARRQAPYKYLHMVQRQLLYRPYWAETDRLEAIESITLADLKVFQRQLLRHNRASLLVYGNIPAAAAETLGTIVAPLTKTGEQGESEKSPVAVVALADPSHWRREVVLPHSDAAIAWYVQGAGDDNEQRVLMGLTAQVIRTPYYHSLRTEQQLGYVVYAAPTILERTPGITFMVQSPVADAGALQEASEALLNDFGEAVATMTVDEFDQHRQALLSLINRPHQNLAGVAGYMWDQLLQEYLAFDRREQLSAALSALTLEQWREFYRDNFLPRPRRSLLVFAPGDREMSPGNWTAAQPVASLPSFRLLNAERIYP